MNIKPLCLLSYSLLVVGCNAGINNPPPTKTNSNSTPAKMVAKNLKTNLTSSTSERLGLGNAIFSNSKYFGARNLCINPINNAGISISKSFITVSLSVNYTMEQLAKNLGVNITGKYNNYDSFGGNATANYLKDVADSNTTLNFNYLQKIQAERRITNVGSLEASDEGMNIFEDSQKEVPQYGSFYDECGDSFVSSLNVGAILAVSVQMNFNNAYDKEIFNMMLHGTWDNTLRSDNFTNIIATAQYFQEVTHQNVKINLRVKQFGGDPLEAAQIIGGKELVTCSSATNLAQCSSLLQNISDYASKKLPNQVNLNDPNTLYSFDILGVTKYNDIYDYIGLPLISSYDIPAATTLARQEIYALYTNDTQDSELIEAYIGSNSRLKDHLSLELNKQLTEVNSALKSRMALYGRGLENACYGIYNNFMGNACFNYYYNNNFVIASNPVLTKYNGLLNYLTNTGYANGTNQRDTTLVMYPLSTQEEGLYGISTVYGSDQISSDAFNLTSTNGVNYTVKNGSTIEYNGKNYSITGSCNKVGTQLSCDYSSNLPAGLLNQIKKWNVINKNPAK